MRALASDHLETSHNNVVEVAHLASTELLRTWVVNADPQRSFERLFLDLGDPLLQDAERADDEGRFVLGRLWRRVGEDQSEGLNCFSLWRRREDHLRTSKV